MTWARTDAYCVVVYLLLELVLVRVVGRSGTLMPNPQGRGGEVLGDGQVAGLDAKEVVKIAWASQKAPTRL
jgi:hypothetical protein